MQLRNQNEKNKGLDLLLCAFTLWVSGSAPHSALPPGKVPWSPGARLEREAFHKNTAYVSWEFRWGAAPWICPICNTWHSDNLHLPLDLQSLASYSHPYLSHHIVIVSLCVQANQPFSFYHVSLILYLNRCNCNFLSRSNNDPKDQGWRFLWKEINTLFFLSKRVSAEADVWLKSNSAKCRHTVCPS